MPRFSKAIDLPRNKIAVDPRRFQGRQGAFSDDTVKAIVAKGRYDRNADEIQVWQDPKDRIYYIISGHSRWEAARQIFESGKQPDLITVPVKQFKGDEDEAIDYATIESNRGSTEEGLKSDLEAYRRAVSRGWNRARLMAAFKPETKLQKLKELVHLSVNSPFLQQMGTAAEKNFPYLERNARWTGILRDSLPLTNEHEQEIFNFFYLENQAGQKLTKDQFFKIINDKVNRIDFDREAPLNLKNRVSSSALTDPITESIREVDRDIDKLTREAAAKRVSIARARTEGVPDVIPGLEQRISDINKIILRLVEQKERLKQASGRLERESFDLFSEPVEPVKVVEPVEDAQSIRDRIKKASRDLEDHRPEKLYNIGDLVNVSHRGKKYEGLKIKEINWDSGNFLLPSRWDYLVQLPDGKTVSSWRNHFEAFDKEKHTEGAITNPYPVFDPDGSIFKIAENAWQGQSFRSEERAQGYMQGEEHYLIQLRERFETLAEKHGTQSDVSSEFKRFITKYREIARDHLHRESGMMSAMITGPARFPTRRMEKKEDAMRSSRKKAEAWEEKAIRAIEKTLTNEPDKLGNPDDLLTQQRAKLAKLEEHSAKMKVLNAAYRKFKTKPESLDKNTELNEAEKRLIKNFVPEYSYVKAPFQTWQLQNTNANIRRIKDRITELEAKSEVAAQDTVPTIRFAGGEVYYNATDNRIQIFFESKPDADVRTELKKNGFKWAPSVQFWQRAITANALHSLASLSFIEYKGHYSNIFTPEKNEPPKIIVETDPEKMQKLENSIAMGESMIKRAADKYAKKAILDDVNKARIKLGMEATTVEEVLSEQKPPADEAKAKRIRIAQAKAKALTLLFTFQKIEA